MGVSVREREEEMDYHGQDDSSEVKCIKLEKIRE